MTRLVLLEHVPAAFRPGPDDLVVALTPEACYELDRQGITYKLTSDFGVDAELTALEPLHWQEQLAWLQEFDELIATHVPETRGWRFGAATLYAFNLKRLMDPVRVRALELDAALGSCDRILLHRRAQVDPPASFRLVFEGPSVTSRVLPLLARARGIDFEERVAEETPEVETAARVREPERGGVLTWLKTPLRAGLRRLREARIALGRPRPVPQLTLLFVDLGYDLTQLLGRAHRRGHRCLRIVDDTVVEATTRPAEIARLPTEGEEPGWASLANEAASPDHTLWDWPNAWLAGVPLSELLRPRVLYWLRDVMPTVTARAAALDELLKSQNIDFVLGANPVLPDGVASAAVAAPPTQSVLIDHGHGAQASEQFDLIMLRHVDHDFCPTSEFARYMESRRNLYDHPTAQIHVGSYQWRANASLSRPERPPQPVPAGKPVVVYALTATAGNGFYLNSGWYTDGWYYRLCRAIVDELARRSDVCSIVKLFPGDGHLRNPIDLYVRDLGLDHVASSRAPLRAWIPWADRIVFDFPSTGLYETAVAGVPYLALLYAHHRHRPTAVEQLGAAAVHFTEPAEAARAVEAFVSSPTATAPRIYPEGKEILDTLEQLAQR